MVDDVICKERGKIYHVPKSTEYRIHTETINEAVMEYHTKDKRWRKRPIFHILMPIKFQFQVTQTFLVKEPVNLKNRREKGKFKVCM